MDGSATCAPSMLLWLAMGALATTQLVSAAGVLLLTPVTTSGISGGGKGVWTVLAKLAARCGGWGGDWLQGTGGSFPTYSTYAGWAGAGVSVTASLVVAIGLAPITALMLAAAFNVGARVCGVSPIRSPGSRGGGSRGVSAAGGLALGEGGLVGGGDGGGEGAPAPGGGPNSWLGPALAGELAVTGRQYGPNMSLPGSWILLREPSAIRISHFVFRWRFTVHLTHSPSQYSN